MVKVNAGRRMASQTKIPRDEYKPLKWAVVVALLVGFMLLKSFVTIIIVAMIVAFLFEPVYKRLNRRFKNPGTAASLTFLITLVVIIVPLVVILLVTVNQAKVMLDDLSNLASGQDYSSIFNNLLDSINKTLTNITGKEYHITTDDIWNQLAHYFSQIASAVLQTITSWASSLGSIITNAILYIYVFTGVLVHQDKLIKLFRKLNPLGKEISDIYLERAGAMTKGMVGGQFTIAIIQGTWSAVVLSLVGMPYFAFFALFLSFLSVIPLGAGIITIPIGIGMILLGDVWQGTVVILNHLLIVTNIDNVLKPKLVPKSVRLHPAIILLAVFGGMKLFGFLGIIVGPVIMVLVTTTINVYQTTVPTAPDIIKSKRTRSKAKAGAAV